MRSATPWTVVETLPDGRERVLARNVDRIEAERVAKGATWAVSLHLDHRPHPLPKGVQQAEGRS